MTQKPIQEPATASREYVDHILTQAKLYAEAIKNYIVTRFVAVILSLLAFILAVLTVILAFAWHLHNDLKQQMQANKTEAKQERQANKAEAKQERQAIHNKLNILIQANQPATPQAKPTSL